MTDAPVISGTPPLTPSLTATPPVAGLPLRIGPTRLEMPGWRRMTSIQPFAGQGTAVDAELRTAFGIGLPAAGQTAEGRTETGDAISLRWMGRNQWFAIGPAGLPDLSGLAAITDQSDGWAVLDLSGPDARAVLARLCPLDLHADVFAPGATARSEVAHMMASVTALPDGFQVMVMRGFAGTLVHDLSGAMASVAAQSGLEAGLKAGVQPGAQ